jgi:hypothetical protein
MLGWSFNPCLLLIVTLAISPWAFAVVAPEFADDRFLVPTFDEATWRLYDNGQQTTTNTASLFMLTSLHGRQLNIAEGPVPEPSSALLATLALATVTSIGCRRRGRTSG